VPRIQMRRGTPQTRNKQKNEAKLAASQSTT
jgi:hypothetical protein